VVELLAHRSGTYRGFIRPDHRSGLAGAPTRPSSYMGISFNAAATAFGSVIIA
jgi:hypothetical protein